MVELKPDHHARGKVVGALRAALHKGHNVVPATKLPKGALSSAKLREAGKAIGADLVVRLQVVAGQLAVTVDATDGRGQVYKGKFKLGRGGIDRKTAVQIVQAIDGSDKLVEKKPEKEEASSEETEPLVLVDPAESEAEAASYPAGSLEELSEDEDYVEPDTKVAYVPRDGRRALTVSAGYTMLVRNAEMSATDGTPPSYEGVMSPGVSLSLSLYPRRFKDGGGAARDFGVYARGWFAFMPTQLISATTGGPVSLAQSITVQAGAVYRHSFGDDPKSVALGAEVGLVWDHVKVASNLPFPETTYISPGVNLLLEVPLARKYVQWITRAGVMPYTAVGGPQVAAFGARRSAFGIYDSTGLRALLVGDMLYAEALGMVSVYWATYKGTGSAGFVNSYGRDLSAGFQVAVGITY